MKEPASREKIRGQPKEFTAVVGKLLRCASRGPARIEFLTETAKTVLELSQGDALDLRLTGPDIAYLWEFAAAPKSLAKFKVIDRDPREWFSSPRWGLRSTVAKKLCSDLIQGRHVRPWVMPPFTTRGRWPVVREETAKAAVALFPFSVDERTVGLLQLKSLRRDFFSKKKLDFCEGLAQGLGIAIANRQAQWALGERVKELTCLYELGRIAQLHGTPLKEILQRIIRILPPAWQFPEIACARITLDGECYRTAGFRQGCHCQTADLLVQGSLRGSIEVVYTEDRPEFAEGPFLPEERSLLETIAREVALVIERRQSEEAQSKLQAQLRHADRLATIGQLAAGVAHELNEPLGNILGFAQLVQKTTGLQKEAAADIDKIVRASLHAREVIHKLLVFSRQKLPVKAQVSLNRVVQEGLYFLESRCSRAGIQVCSKLASDLPDLDADSSQLQQVLVNLVVNGIQAMPDGGTLTIETRAARDFVSLSVTDTGCGMTDEVKERLFTPFFTTKDVDQGTGLGLAVVHGIVTAHHGTIHVESAPGQGARFEVRLPRGGNVGVKEDPLRG